MRDERPLFYATRVPKPRFIHAVPCGRRFPLIVRHGYASRQIQASRATAHWQRIRQERLRLDGYECQLRYEGCTTIADSVHLDASANGDHLAATILNTLSTCRRCHSKRGGL